MTTTNNGGIHPIVMKAAKAQFACDFSLSADDDPELWENFRDSYVRDAQRVLTECGALECLEALELLLNNVGKNSDYPGAQVARKAIAKVYGSAP